MRSIRGAGASCIAPRSRVRPSKRTERNVAQGTERRGMNLAQLLDLELPIIQAPMAGVQLGALAAAVSGAGGLGSLPCAMLTPEAMVKELELIRSFTAKPFNVNFFC